VYSPKASATQYELSKAHPSTVTGLPSSIKARLGQRAPILVLTQMHFGKAQRDAHIGHHISNAQVVPDEHTLLKPRVALQKLTQHRQYPARTAEPICPFSLALPGEGNRATLPNQVFCLFQSSLTIGKDAQLPEGARDSLLVVQRPPQGQAFLT
jgi:hypothetical protein